MHTTTRPPRHRRRHCGAAFVAINTDWDALRRSPQARRAIRRWRADHIEPFRDVVDLADVITALSECATPAESDRWLAPLMKLATAGDRIAERTLLQAMLPMAITLYRTRHGGTDDQWNVVSVLAEQIGRYPLHAHPTRIAGHLRFMTRRALWRQHRRLRIPTCPLGTANTRGGDDRDDALSLLEMLPGDPDPRSSFDQLTDAIVDVVAAGNVEADSATLLLSIAAGERVVGLAARAGCHHSVMSRRIAAATRTIADAVQRARLVDTATIDDDPSRNVIASSPGRHQ